MKQEMMRYKRDYDKRSKTSNPDISAGYFVYLNHSEGKNTGKLGGHALGTFAVLDRTARIFVIQRRDLVEKVNGDRITK